MLSHLVVQELSKKYDSFVALVPTNFELMGGEISILSGPNGSGKTTLLSCLTGLVPLSSGSVQVMGYDLYRDEVEVRHRMIYVPDVPRFYLELTAWEHLRFIALANGVEKDFEQKAERLMKKYGIWETKDLFPHHYSRGMRLKLGLALALIRPFDVLLLDEPTSALDEEGVRMLVEELRGMQMPGLAWLVPGMVAAISFAAVFDVIRRSRSGLLLNGSVPELSAGGILLGILLAGIPLMIYMLAPGILGMLLAIILSWGMGYLAFELVAYAYRNIDHA